MALVGKSAVSMSDTAMVDLAMVDLAMVDPAMVDPAMVDLAASNFLIRKSFLSIRLTGDQCPRGDLNPYTLASTRT